MAPLKVIRNFNHKHWVSKSEAARLRGISRQAIWELVKRGRLVAAAYGRRMYLRRADVLNFKHRKKGRHYRVPATEVISRLKKKRLDPAKWFSMTEAAYTLGLTHQVISDLVRRGRLRALSSDGKTLILRSSLEKFKAGQPAPNPSFFPKPARKRSRRN
jgi:excisionase family DNA binding protein